MEAAGSAHLVERKSVTVVVSRKRDSGEDEAWDELVVVAHTGTSGERETENDSILFLFLVFP